MYQFKHEFRELRSIDGYEGCLDLCTGDKPLICEVVSEDDNVDIIISGTGVCPSCEETMITLVTADNDEYILVLPHFNTVSLIVADFIVDRLESNKEDLQGALKTLVEDLDMVNIPKFD